MEVIRESMVQGVKLFDSKIRYDNRGALIKGFNKGLFLSCGVYFQPQEMFYSTSYENVLRGMHAQKGQAKLVSCISGMIEDIVLDLRDYSPTYGQWDRFCLSEANNYSIFIPEGVAHGFLTVYNNENTVLYLTDSDHDPEKEIGILWNSFGYSWDKARPILSNKDKYNMTFEEYKENPVFIDEYLF